MGTKKAEYYARLAEARKLGKYNDPILEELLQAARAEEQAELEAEAGAHDKKLDEIIEESPIGHPHCR